MGSIEYINKLINEVIIEVDNLIVEQSSSLRDYDKFLKDSSKTDEEKIKKIIDIQDQSVSQSERIEMDDIYDDLSSGRWPKDFPSEEELNKHFQDGTNTTYTIQDGKNAGKKITSGGYEAMRLYRGAKSVKSRVTSGQKKKGKGHTSVCYCVGFARQFSPDASTEENKCPKNQKRFCEKQWLEDLDTWMGTQNKYTQEIAEEYREDCVGRYDVEMFDRETRDLYVFSNSEVPNTPYCSKWDDEVKSNLEGIESGLSSLLSKYFRVKNAKNLQVKAEGGSIADKLVMYSKMDIEFNPDPVDYKPNPGGNPPRENVIPAYPACKSNSYNIKQGDTIQFNIVSASGLNKGKTVFLEKGGKFLLMTFGTAERDKPQSGKLKFTDNGGTDVCPQISWGGKIKRLYTS